MTGETPAKPKRSAAKPAGPKPVEKRRAADESPSRLVNMKQLGDLIGRDRNTIYGWLEKDCPYVQKGDRDAGREWIFDVAKVVRWRERYVVEEAIAEADKGARELRNVDLDPKEMVELARAQIKLNTERRQVAPVAMQGALWERALGLIRQSVMSLPNRFVGLIPGLGDDETYRIYEEVESMCADLLEDAAKEVKEATRAYASG